MSRNRTQKSAINASVSLGAHLFSIVLSFVARTVFVACMQTEYLGISGLFTNILTVLSLAELGLGDALLFALYRPMKEQNRDELARLIGFAKKIYYVLALVVLLIGTGVSFFLNSLIKDVPDIPESLRVIFFIYLANSAASYLMAYKSMILTADQRQYVSSLIGQGAKVAQLLLQIGVLLISQNFYAYLVCQVICTLGNNVAVMVYINRHYPYLNKKGVGKPEKQTVKKMISDVRSLSVSKIAGVVANGTDNIIISKLIGLTQVGLASNYSMIVSAANGVLWQGVNALMGSIGNFNVDAEEERKGKVFDQLQLLSYWLYSFVFIGITVMANSFVGECWLGEEFLLDSKTVFAMALPLYVSGVNYAAYSFRVTKGVFGKIQYFHLAAGVLNLVVSVLAAPYLGMFGVFLATSVTRVLTSELADGYLVAKKVLGRTFRWYVGKYVLLFGVMMGNLLITGAAVHFIPLSGMIGFLVKGVCCVLVCNGIFLLVFGKTEAFRGLLGRGKALRGK